MLSRQIDVSLLVLPASADLLAHRSHRLRSHMGFAQPAPDFAILAVEVPHKFIVRLVAELANPLLVEFRLGEHRSRVFSEFGHIDDHAAQMVGDSLLQNVDASVGHDGDPGTSNQNVR